MNQDTVFKVCDQPHPHIARGILEACLEGRLDDALAGLRGLSESGYAPVDIVGTLFKVVKSHKMPEARQLEGSRRSASAILGLPTDVRLAGAADGHGRAALPAGRGGEKK